MTEKSREQSAFVLVNTEYDMDQTVAKELRKNTNVRESHCVYGVFDGVVKVEAGNIEKLRDVVEWEIKKENGVRSVVPLIIKKSLADGKPIGFVKDSQTGEIKYIHPSLKVSEATT